jgi:ferredoxin
MPPSDALMRRLRTLLSTYAEAAGERAVVLFHDGEHGADLIDALARFGDGLPANVLPVAVNEITQIGLEAVTACFAYGASAVRFLTRAKPKHDLSGLHRTIALSEPVLAGLGFVGPRVATIETDDPDALGASLRAMSPMIPAERSASFMPVGSKRELVRLALRELHAVAPAQPDIVPLPQGAPFGTVVLDAEGCTLCLSCVSACPTGALSSDPDKPMLRFAEDACVQCGLCQSTCPEKVIALKPQIDFRAATAMARVLKQEEPYECIRCGKAFGVKSSVERVIAKLEGKHWMYKDSKKRLDVIRMCEDCRVNVMADEQFDPFGAPQRPKPKTTEDYLREREKK